MENLTEVRLGVELALIDLVIDRMSDEHADKLREALRADEAESAPVNTAHDLHATIASLAGNRALELVELVLIRLTRLHQVERKPGSRSGIKRDVYRAHEAIVAAIIDGDRELARHRMRRHLTAIATHLT